MSLLEHPLNEAHPVSFFPQSVNDTHNICTNMEILHVEKTLPMCILFDPITGHTKFAMICGPTKQSSPDFNGANESQESMSNSEVFMRQSIDHDMSSNTNQSTFMFNALLP